jgi:hypothetical protein
MTGIFHQVYPCEQSVRGSQMHLFKEKALEMPEGSQWVGAGEQGVLS